MTPRDREGVALVYHSTFVPDSRPHCWKISEFSFFVTMLFNRDKMAQVFYSFLSLTPRQLPTLHLMRKLPNIGFQRNFSYWNKWIPSLSTSSEEGILPPQLFVSIPFMTYIKVFKISMFARTYKATYIYNKRRCRRTIFIQVLLCSDVRCHETM